MPTMKRQIIIFTSCSAETPLNDRGAAIKIVDDNGGFENERKWKYQSAVSCSEKGYEQKDQKASFRALELFDMACNLIEQNTDESISELSIRRQRA